MAVERTGYFGRSGCAAAAVAVAASIGQVRQVMHCELRVPRRKSAERRELSSEPPERTSAQPDGGDELMQLEAEPIVCV